MLRIISKKGFFLSLVITVSLVSAIMLSILLTGEYIAYAQLNSNLDRALIDARMEIRVSNFEEFNELYVELSSLPELSWVNIYFYRYEKEIALQSNNIMLQPKNLGKWVLLLGLDPDHWPNNLTLIQGRYPMNNSEIALDLSMAKALNVTVGDEIWIRSIYENESIRFTVVGIMNIQGLLADLLSSEPPIRNPALILTLNASRNLVGVCFFTIDSMASVNGIGASFSGFPVYIMKFNRIYFFDPWNPADMLTRIKAIQDKVINIALNYTDITQIFFYNYAEQVIKDYASWPSAFRLQLTYIVLPALFIGSIYAVVIGWIFVNERRREIALLRIRGFSDFQIFLIYLIEYLLVSIIGGFLGFLLSILTAIVSPYVLLSYFTQRYNPVPVIFRNISYYFIASNLIALLTAALTMFPACLKGLRMSILDGLSEFVEEIEKEKLPIFIFLGLLYGLIGLAEILCDLPLFKFAVNNLMQSTSTLLQITGFVLFIVDCIVIASSPFILAYSLGSITAHYASRFKRVLSYLVNLIVPSDVVDVAVTYFVRKPSRIARIVFIVALILSLLMEAGFNSAINVSSLKKQVEIFVGADYRVDIYRYGSPINMSLIEKEIMQHYDGVKIADVYEFWGRARRIGLPYIKVIAIDEEYFDVAFLDKNFFDGITIEEAYKALFKKREVLLGVSARNDFGMRIGDKLRIHIRAKRGFAEKYIEVSIAGFFFFAPGLLRDIYDAQKTDYIVMMISVKSLKELTNLPDKLLINIPEGLNTKEFTDFLKTTLSSNGIISAIYSFATLLNLSLNSSLAGITATLFKLEFAELIALTILGVYLVFYSEYFTRKREFALLWARGIEKRDIISMASVEALLVVIFSLIISLVIAYSFSLSLTKLTNMGLIGSLKPPIIPVAVFPIDVFLTIIGELIAVWIGAKIAIRQALREEFVQLLRIHH